MDQDFAVNLSRLSAGERHRVLVEWNTTEREYSRDSCVHQLFAEQATERPGALAVSGMGVTLTYGELERRSNLLAHYLRSLGVGPDVLVGVCMERSPEMMVAMLGVSKAGGAYVPMDPAYPRERLAFMVEDAAAPVLLTQERLVGILPPTRATVVSLDKDWAMIARDGGGSEGPPETAVTPDHLVYVIYTSGSTGTPKGVEMSHAGLLNLVYWFRRAYGVTPQDRISYAAGIGFDASVSEIWPCLTAGASLHLPDDETRLNPIQLQQWLIRERLTIAFAPTPMMESLLALEWPDAVDLRFLYTGGDKLRRRPSPSVTFAVADNYGPTEAACISTFTLVEPAGVDAGAPHIGRPIDNVNIYILDEHMEPVPIGEAGELYIGGASLGRGYRNRPDLTRERFVPNPFSEQPGARLYRTGDLARYRLDGCVEFIGRRDHQVKIRGFRIELGEIETVLSESPAVREAVVLVREDQTGDKRLVAYWVPADPAAASESLLRDALQARLPAYMVPSLFVALETMPLTANGKVDRQALPEPVWTHRTEPFARAATQTEQVLAEIWAEVLGLEQVGIHDHFFQLGGHSLRAIQVVTRIRERLGAAVSILTMFERPTIAQLAALIDGTSETALQNPPPITPVSREQPLPLSLSQEPIWFLQQLSPEMMSYNFQATIRMVGQLNLGVLEQALTEIVRRHEIFRTTFPAVDGQPVQQIHEPWQVQVPLIDLTGLPEEERQAEADRRVRALFRKPFDLTRLPLIRWEVLRLAPEEYLLAQVEHHFVHDGWSFAVFLRELTELYRALMAGRPSPLPELEVQYADFALWQRKWLTGGTEAAQVAYWKKRLAGALPLLELPTDRPRPPVQSFLGTSQRIQLPAALSNAIRQLSRQEGVTLFMTLMAAFQTLLYRYTRQEDLVVASGVANRRWKQIEPIIGMVVNTVALRTDLSGNPTFRELLERVRAVTVEAYANADLPFDRVVDALAPERSLSYLPVCQVAFSFHNAALPDLALPELQLELTEGHSNGSAKFDLNVMTIPRAEMYGGSGSAPEELIMVWEYNTDIFEDETISRMIAQYQRLLAAVVTEPDQRLTDLPLLPDGEAAQLAAWNETTAEFPTERLAHHLFEEQASRRPEALAVTYGDAVLTYGELNERAEQLARTLRNMGVGPEKLVALYMERSIEMVVGALAVLKAGGAYLPIDPQNPPEHLAYMLTDSGAVVALTQERLVDRLPQDLVRLRCLDSEWVQIVREGELGIKKSASPTPTNLAYVIYTSGSTGRPKGVEVEHRSLLNLIYWHQRTFEITERDRTTVVAGVGFDAAVWDLWPALAAGASLHIIDEETRIAPEALRNWLVDRAITVSFLPTPLTEAVLGLEWPTHTCLRFLLTGGDKLRSYPRAGLPFQLVNNYGPTENTVVTTSDVVLPCDTPEAPPTIGRPIANTYLYVLDAELQPVPIGAPGELYVGGASVARGYRFRPELTSERFIPNPFRTESGERLYRTGDMVRFRPDGTLEFLGRQDDQVKLRGYRIEVGEIEVVLSQHPSVEQAVVTVREDQPGELQLAAYVVGHTDLSAEELRRFLKERLPAYMEPAVFVTMDKLPLTPNGKVDRRALPVPEGTGEAAGLVPPRTPVETALAQIWQEILGLDRVGIHDNFFELGGHSLMTTRVMTRVRVQFGVELPLRALFESPTIAGLASLVEKARLEQADENDLEQLLAQIDQLSEEEALALLKEEESKSDL